MEISTALALLASAFLGTAVVIANVGLRYLDPARGALVSIPSTTLLFGLLAAFLFRGEGWNAAAFAIFAAVGLIFPALVTFLNFASNRLTGPTVAGTISSTTPLFAVLGAILFLGEPLSPAATAGTPAIVLGGIALTARGSGPPRSRAAWGILLPLAGGRVSVVSPLVATYPLFTLALSALFLREEKFAPRVLLGVALTVAGVVVLARA